MRQRENSQPTPETRIQQARQEKPSTPVTGISSRSDTVETFRPALSTAVSVVSAYSSGTPSALGAQPSSPPWTIMRWVTLPPVMIGQQVCRVSPRSTPAASGSMTSVRVWSTISGFELIL